MWSGVECWGQPGVGQDGGPQNSLLAVPDAAVAWMHMATGGAQMFVAAGFLRAVCPAWMHLTVWCPGWIVEFLYQNLPQAVSWCGPFS